MNQIQRILTLGQRWQTTFKHFINNPPQDALLFLKRFIDLTLMGTEVASLTQILRHNLNIKQIEEKKEA